MLYTQSRNNGVIFQTKANADLFPRNVKFVLKSSEKVNTSASIETVFNKPHKFLGATVTYTNTPKEYSEQLSKILSVKLENIDLSKVRGEHKLKIYE